MLATNCIDLSNIYLYIHDPIIHGVWVYSISSQKELKYL